MKISYNKKGIKALGKKIKELRKAQGISQAQLAFECGTAQKQISRIENGEINTSVAELLAISKVLHIHVKEFFNFDY